MKKIALLLFLFISGKIFAQLPETDLFLVDVQQSDTSFRFGKPVNITNHRGYDNHPSFSPDGKSILYCAETVANQTDVYLYNVENKSIKQITKTKESEYSPKMIPGRDRISVVRVDKDSAQRFYEIKMNGRRAENLFPDIDSAAYYDWINENYVGIFILGEPDLFKIMVASKKLAKQFEEAREEHEKKEKKNPIENIHKGIEFPETESFCVSYMANHFGHCFKKVPGRQEIAFVIQDYPTKWELMKYDSTFLETSTIIQTLDSSEDFAFMPDRTVLMSQGSKLFRYNPYRDRWWVEIADFKETIGNFYRMSVSPSGDKICFVAYTGKKP